MSVCGILCGADDWNSIRLFAEHKEDWFRKHLTLPGGIPVAITFNRIFASLDPEEFRKIFIQWIRDVLSGLELSDSRIVALDGKTVKGSAWNKGKDAIHMLNAWCTEAGLSLGQYKVDAKSNEITAIPELLKLLEISGCLVTIDAMGCQKKIATAIMKKEADYLLAVKGYQKKLYGEVTRTFDQYWQNNPVDAPDQYFAEQEDKDHGRVEHRRCWVSNDISEDSSAASWGAKTIAAIQLDSCRKGKGNSLIRYFISSRQLSAEDRSGTPWQALVTWAKTRCSIGLYFEQWDGKWATRIFNPKRSPRDCKSSLKRYDLALLLPPQSHKISISSRPG